MNWKGYSVTVRVRQCKDFGKEMLERTKKAGEQTSAEQHQGGVKGHEANHRLQHQRLSAGGQPGQSHWAWMCLSTFPVQNPLLGLLTQEESSHSTYQIHHHLTITPTCLALTASVPWYWRSVQPSCLVSRNRSSTPFVAGKSTSATGKKSCLVPVPKKATSMSSDRLP